MENPAMQSQFLSERHSQGLDRLRQLHSQSRTSSAPATLAAPLGGAHGNFARPQVFTGDMTNNRTFSILAIGGALLLSAGCSTAPPLPPVPVMPVQAPVIPAYVHGEAIGGYSARVRKARAAGIRPLTAVAAAAYVAQQESQLRQQLAGTGAEVFRTGERLLIRLPANFAFAVGSSALTPQALSTVSEIGLTLRDQKQTLIDVLGHTDSTGTPAANKALSERRAAAVAAELRKRGVAAARIATRGHGSAYPIADNGTETGRAENRRLEIIVIPLR